MVKMNRKKDDFNREIGIRLHNFRIQAGYTQAEIAEMIGLSDGKVYGQYETGYAAIPHKRLKDLCEILGVTPNDVYGFTEPQVTRMDIAKRMLKNAGIKYNDFGKQQVSFPIDQFQEYDYLPSSLDIELKFTDKKMAAIGNSYFISNHEELLRCINSAKTQTMKEIEAERRAIFKIKFKSNLCRMLASTAYKGILKEMLQWKETLTELDGDKQ